MNVTAHKLARPWPLPRQSSTDRWITEVVRPLAQLLADGKAATLGAIPWAAPVPSFGDPSGARVASLGLNPSNLEFVDDSGDELSERNRRFHTLSSLAKPKWDTADVGDLELVWNACCRYFQGNPYDAWFRQLDYIVNAAGVSYYGANAEACHLDLVPYATYSKWTSLDRTHREALLLIGAKFLGTVLKHSAITTLVLNGRSVVDNFARISDAALVTSTVPDWALSRGTSSVVRGVAFRGLVRIVGGVDLQRRILVLGYNHNLQSSFGVTRDVRKAIREWVGQQTSTRLT